MIRFMRWAILLVAAHSFAQAPSPGGMSIGGLEDLKAGKLEWDLETNAMTLEGAVSGVVPAKDPNEKPMRFRADRLETEPETGAGGGFKRVLMVGAVQIEFADGRVSAGKAEFDQSANKIIFTGDPVYTAAVAPKGLRGSRIEFDLNTSKVIVLDMDLKQYVPQAGGSRPRDPSLLTVTSVRELPVLLGAVKQQYAADGPSPGKRLLSLLDADTRARFALLPTDKELPEDLQQTVLSKFNGVLQRTDFYDAASFKGVKLDNDTQALLKQGPEKLDSTSLTRLNRGLLAAAFPAHISRAD